MTEVMDNQEVEYTSNREIDENGYITVKDNPIIRAGVFQYKGSQIGHDADPNQIYNVYRPLEELTRPETMNSFIGLPIIDEHEMLGEKHARGAEERGVHGAILENIRIVANDVLAPLRIFSKTLKRVLEAGKKGVSMGYKCRFEKSSGEFCGMPYNYVQRDIVGNHLAIVMQGRNGTTVLDEHDVFDHFDLALDTGENIMAEAPATEEKKEVEAAVVDLAACHAFLVENAPMWAELQALMGANAATEANALDKDEDEKEGEKKAEDEDDKKDEKEEKKEAMDSAAVNAAIEGRLATERKTMMKNIMAGVSARDELAKKLVPHVGTFAFDSMDADEVAAYGADKLGIKAEKGQEAVAVTAFLAGMEKGKGAAVTYSMDSAATPKPKADSPLAKRFTNAAA
jgi:hypothetical protein